MDFKKNFIEDHDRMNKYIHFVNRLKTIEHKNIAKIHHCELLEGTHFATDRNSVMHKAQKDSYLLQLLQLHFRACHIEEKVTRQYLPLKRATVHYGNSLGCGSIFAETRHFNGRVSLQDHLSIS